VLTDMPFGASQICTCPLRPWTVSPGSPITRLMK